MRSVEVGSYRASPTSAHPERNVGIGTVSQHRSGSNRGILVYSPCNALTLDADYGAVY
jgi:hypothetical protein